MAAFFHLRVLASDRAFYDGDCESLTVPVSDGELGILAAFFTTLGDNLALLALSAPEA